MELNQPHSPLNDFEQDENPPLIDFDFRTGQFNLKTIHPSLKKIFKHVGITKKDLKDKRMVPVIFDAVIKAFSELHLSPDNGKKNHKKTVDYLLEVQDEEKEKGKDILLSPRSPIISEECVIRFDLNLGIFEIESLHPTLRRIFKKAKITKKDLRNKEMAITIMHAIMESFCEIHSLTESQQMMKSGDLLTYEKKK